MNKITKIISIILVLALLVIGIFFLPKNGIKDIEISNIIPKNETPSIKGCYVSKISKDVYTLDIESEKDGNVQGLLSYNNYQKDSSQGTFNGNYKDNILIGNYSFDSEGMHSDRKIVFKKIDNGLIPGYGPIDFSNEKDILGNLSKINFDPKYTFYLSKDCTNTFTDSNNTFSFEYNPLFQVVEPGYLAPGKDWKMNSEQNGILLTRVVIPRFYMLNTNFVDANLTIGRSTDATAIKNCTQLGLNEKQDGEKNISSYPFSKFIFNGAAAGNLYETTSYRGIFDGDCYVIEYTIHSGNIGNYSPNQGIVEFDKQKIQNELEKIINSFKFLLSSN